MRKVVQVVGGLLGLGFAATAWGQSRARSHPSTASTSHVLHESRSPSPPPDYDLRAPSTLAYLDGRQHLVGLHAPSTDPPVRDAHGRPVLALRSVNRSETLQVDVQRDDGGFTSVDLDRVAHFMRAANGDEHPIDGRVLGLVYRIQTHFAVPEIRMVSGYRTPRPGSHSNHAKGRAMDLIVPGVTDEEVAEYARGFGFAGVGVYPKSQFVHVDIRPRSYFWVDSSSPHTRNREHAILGGLAKSSDEAAVARGQLAIEPFKIGTDVDSALRSLEPAAPPTTTDDDEEDEN